MKFFYIITLSLALVLSIDASAQGYTYNSDTCDFTLDLPETVNVQRQCSVLDEDGNETCVERLAYTKTVESSTTIQIDLSCNGLGDVVYDNYNKDKMLFTAESYLISQANTLDDYELRYIEHENSKRVLVFGSGKSGLSDMIYFGHIWLGRNSLLSMNAKIVGSGNVLADNVFKSILVSLVNKKDDPVIEVVQETAPE